jgi:hypothetical protein
VRRGSSKDSIGKGGSVVSYVTSLQLISGHVPASDLNLETFPNPTYRPPFVEAGLEALHSFLPLRLVLRS